MAYHRRVGDVPPKRHTQHRDAEGRLYHKELMGEEGFSSDSALLYHRAAWPARTPTTPGRGRAGAARARPGERPSVPGPLT